MNGNLIQRNSIPVNRLNRDQLKALLTQLLDEMDIGTGAGGGTGVGTLSYTLTNQASGALINHGLATLTVSCTGKRPDGTTDPAVTVQPALDTNGQPDPNYSILNCPDGWTGTVYLQAA